MIILIFVLAVGLSLLSFWFAACADEKRKSGCCGLGVLTGIVGCMFAGAMLMWFASEVPNALQCRVIDEKIAIYQRVRRNMQPQRRNFAVRKKKTKKSRIKSMHS